MRVAGETYEKDDEETRERRAGDEARDEASPYASVRGESTDFARSPRFHTIASST